MRRIERVDEPVLRPLHDHGSHRWLAELSARDRRRYADLVAPAIPAIERALASDVFANRAGLDGILYPHGAARGAWDRALASVDPRSAAVIADVRRCFASIEPEAVDRSLAIAGVDLDARGGIESFLHAIAWTGLRGLPVGPAPSAILANGVLAVADAAATRAGARILRWVDDVVMVAAEERVAVRAFDAWARAIGELGLAPHEGKLRRVHEIGTDEAWWGRGGAARPPSGAVA